MTLQDAMLGIALLGGGMLIPLVWLRLNNKPPRIELHKGQIEEYEKHMEYMRMQQEMWNK